MNLLAGVTVLYVEDDTDTREMMTVALRRYGARVLTAESAQMALLLFEEEQPDVIVSDLSLPDVDGCALLRAMRALRSGRMARTPAVLVTAHDGPGVRSSSLSAGYALHLTKPVSPDDLAHRVAVLAKREG